MKDKALWAEPIRGWSSFEHMIAEELTIRFPVSLEKRPLITYMSDSSGNLVCPFFYGLNLVKEFNMIELSDVERPTVDMEFKADLWDNQEKVIKKALSHINEHRTVIMSAYTGAGKTRMSAYIACHLKLLTMIVIVNKTLLDQWINDLGVTTNAIIRLVDLTKDSYYQFGKKLPESPDHYDIILCMIGRIKKVEPSILDIVGLLVMDEAHTFCSPEGIKSIMRVHPSHILQCTATPDRDDGCTKFLYLISGQHKVITYKSGLVTVRIIKTSFKPVSERQPHSFRIDWTKAKQSLYNNNNRNRLAVDLVTRWVTKDSPERTIILVDEIEHGLELVKMFEERGVTVSKILGTKVNFKKTPYEPRQVLVATHHKVGAGFDEANFMKPEIRARGFAPLARMLILFSGKQVYKWIQCVGRIRSNNSDISYFYDDSNTLRDHMKAFLEAFIHQDRIVKTYIVTPNNTLALTGSCKYQALPELDEKGV
jgi:hypothetical protein